MSNIVVIQEDKLMRGLLVAWLSAIAYSVRAPAPADIDASDGPPDLATVDGHMPGRRQRLRTVKAVHPGTPVIAISGQFRSGLVETCAAAQAIGVQRVIAKPFSLHDLLGAVHCVLVQAG